MARVTKKDIYAKYGIEYDTATQKIYNPFNNEWITELLKDGNTKTGKAVKCWAMSTKTCSIQCEKCYGKRGFYAFGNGLEMLNRNAELAMLHLDFFKRAIMAQCETFKDGTEIRIHVVGDFFSVEYVKVWQGVIETYPQLIFWTYTKVTKYENAFAEYPNANIVKSVINGKFNFGHCDHIIDLYTELKDNGKNVHICRCGVDDNQHCSGCHKCSLCDYVLFIEHSTEYVAKDDPLYNTLKAIIDNQ